MGLERLSRRLGAAVAALLLAAVVYGIAGVVIALVPGVENATVRAMPWPRFLPSWPAPVLVLAALTVTGVYTVVVLVLRVRKRRAAVEQSACADAWLQGPVARAAGSTGLRLTRIGGFRARPRSSHVVELSWNPPLDAVDEVFVWRSTNGFATSPEPGSDQMLLCRAVESTHVDADLTDERVYFYTAYARGRDGSWSSPSWAWAVTPRLPLHSTVMGSMRTLRQGNLDW